MSASGGGGPQDQPTEAGATTAGGGNLAVRALSWAAATWTVPFVPGVAGTAVLALGLGASGVPPLLLAATVLLVLAAAGVTALVLGRAAVSRGVGAGLVAGAAVTGRPGPGRAAMTPQAGRPTGKASGWYGPASVVGAVVGVVLWAVPYATFSRPLWVWLVPPLAGLVLLAVRGPARRFGVGLLASCVTLPVAFVVFGLLGLLFQS